MVEQRDGHCVITVIDANGESVELVITLAVRDLFVDFVVDRLAIDDGERVWYRKRGG